MKAAILLVLLIVGANTISMPASMKSALSEAWSAVHTDVEAFGKCMAGAAKGMALAEVKKHIPTSATSFMSLIGMGRRRLGFLSWAENKAKEAGNAVKGAASAAGNALKGVACKMGAGPAENACKSAVSAGVGKAAGLLKKKMASLNTGAAQGCLTKLGNAGCAAARKKACGRRLISMPASMKSTMSEAWAAVHTDVEAFGKCMAGAAKGMALAEVKKHIPTSATSFMSLIGMGRRLGFLSWAENKAKAAGNAVKGAASAAGNALKGVACKMGAGPAENACKSAVSAGVGKAASALKSKMSSLNTTAAQGCLKTLGNAGCAAARKKACGRRLIAMPAAMKTAMSDAWAAVHGDVEAFGSCMAGAAKGMALAEVKKHIPTSASSFMSLVGMGRRLSFLSSAKDKASSAAHAVSGAASAAGNALKGAACAMGAGPAESACKSAVSAGVSKAADALKSKMASLDTHAAQGCLSTLGNAGCAAARKKACGRRRF